MADAPSAPVGWGGFRPCIDIHDGRVKQIVGGSIDGEKEGVVKENFVSDQPSEHYAELYKVWPAHIAPPPPCVIARDPLSAMTVPPPPSC